MNHEILDTWHQGKVRILRTRLIPHLLPVLREDGTYTPGPHLTDMFPKEAVVGLHEWDDGCWPYFVADNDSRHTHVARPLTMVEAATMGIYAFGEWRPEVDRGAPIVACGCSTVVVRTGWTKSGKSPPVIRATAQARVHVGIEAHVHASGNAHVYVSGSSTAPVEVEARGTSVVFVLGTHVTVRTSEGATVLYVAAEPSCRELPAGDDDEETIPCDEESASIGSIIASRTSQCGWSHRETEPIRKARDRGAIPAPSAKELREASVREGWGLIEGPVIAEDAPCPPLAALLRLRGRRLLFALEEVGWGGHTHLLALVPWITSLTVSDSSIEVSRAAVAALCTAVHLGSTEAHQALLGLMTPAINGRILATILGNAPLWPGMWERVLATDLTTYNEEAADRYGAVVSGEDLDPDAPAPDADRVAEVVRRTITASPHREVIVEAMLRAVLHYRWENLTARESLRDLILCVLPVVRDEKLAILVAKAVAGTVHDRALVPSERKALIRALRSARTPKVAASLALLLHGAPI